LDDNYFLSKEFSVILKKYEDARKAGDSVYLEADDLTDIADYYNMHGQVDKALEAVDYALQLFPHAASPLAFKSRAALFLDNDPEKARRFIDEIADKSDEEYIYAKAEILLYEEKPEEANDFLEEYYEKAEDAEDFVLDVAKLFVDYNYFEYTEHWLERSTERQDPDYLELKARLYLNDDQLEESEKIINHLLDLNPYCTTYWNLLSIVQYKNHDMRKSIESCDFSLAINPNDFDALQNKANCQYMLGNFQEALDNFKKALAIQPNNVSTEINIASTLSNMNRAQEAYQHLLHAYQVCKPTEANYPELLTQLTYISAFLNHFDVTTVCLHKLENLPGYNKWYVDILRGYLFLMQEQPQKARAVFFNVIQQAPSSFDLYLKIANCCYDAGYVDMGYYILSQQIKKFTPQEAASGYALLALCAYELGMKKEFLENLKMSAQVSERETWLMLHDKFPENMAPSEYYEYAKSHQLPKAPETNKEASH
jgi:tetratricopeptide (TPR) repeat protein